MSFTFDLQKSRSNQMKHGIDFVEAQKIWLDSRRIQFPVPFPTEDRFMVIGKINGKFWTAVITHRDEVTRLISVRRSRTNEVKIYES